MSNSSSSSNNPVVNNNNSNNADNRQMFHVQCTSTLERNKQVVYKMSLTKTQVPNMKFTPGCLVCTMIAMYYNTGNDIENKFKRLTVLSEPPPNALTILGTNIERVIINNFCIFHASIFNVIAKKVYIENYSYPALAPIPEIPLSATRTSFPILSLLPTNYSVNEFETMINNSYKESNVYDLVKDKAIVVNLTARLFKALISSETDITEDLLKMPTLAVISAINYFGGCQDAFYDPSVNISKSTVLVTLSQEFASRIIRYPPPIYSRGQLEMIRNHFKFDNQGGTDTNTISPHLLLTMNLSSFPPFDVRTILSFLAQSYDCSENQMANFPGAATTNCSIVDGWVHMGTGNGANLYIKLNNSTHYTEVAGSKWGDEVLPKEFISTTLVIPSTIVTNDNNLLPIAIYRTNFTPKQTSKIEITGNSMF